MVLAMAIGGGTLAAINTNTEGSAGTGVTEVGTQGVGIEIVTQGTAEETLTAGNPTPGGSYEFLGYVSNKMENGYAIYAMATVYKSWDCDRLDAAKVGITYLDEEEVSVDYADIYSGDMTEASNGWIVVYEDEEELMLVYTKPISYGESSTHFMDAVVFDADMNNKYADKEFTFEVEVKAVQVNAGEAAMQSEWGWFPLIDEDGNILGVYETEALRDAAAAAL